MNSKNNINDLGREHNLQYEDEKISTGVLYRQLEMRPPGIGYGDDEENDSRVVELAFSSESPVERFFGNEVLDHGESSVRLGRLLDGAPLLVNHDPANHVGVVETASIDADRMGRATVRFGNSALAKEVYADVVDGIRKHVSVGYVIHNMREEENDVVRATLRDRDWET